MDKSLLSASGKYTKISFPHVGLPLLYCFGLYFTLNRAISLKNNLEAI